MGNLVARHFNESVDTKRKQILRNVKTYLLEIYNTSSNTLYISFDGTNWHTIGAGGNRKYRAFANKPIHLDRFYVKGSAAGTTFEIVYFEEGEDDG